MGEFFHVAWAAAAGARSLLIAVNERALELSLALSQVIADKRVLAAIAEIPRERFVGPHEREHAYDNVALPIACGQTISQPVVVARMLELLELSGGEQVLDVGTGSGYHAALLSLLTRRVFSIERYAELSDQAAATLTELGITNVTCVVGDGSLGLESHAPFDAINVAAASGRELPPALLGQLAEGGRLVAPVGRRRQHLIRAVRTREGVRQDRLDPVRFVPLVPDSEE